MRVTQPEPDFPEFTGESQSICDRATFFADMEKLPQTLFNDFCNDVLSAWEFMHENQGRYVTEDSHVANLYSGLRLVPIVRSYSLEYILEELYPIESPVAIIAQSVDAFGFDRETFFYGLHRLTDKQFHAFLLEVKFLACYRSMITGHYLVPRKAAERHPDVCRKMDYTPYSNAIQSKVELSL